NTLMVGLAVVVIGGSTIGIIWAYILLPGFALLLSPFMGRTVFLYGGTLESFPWVYPVAMVAQAVMIAILFSAICRRYRGTYPTTFNLLQSLLLLLAWCIISGVGMHYWDHIHLTTFSID